MSPEFVSFASIGANGTEATSVTIIGGNLFSSRANTEQKTRAIANAAGHPTWRNFMSGLSPMFDPMSSR